MKSEFNVETLAAIDENPLYRESDRGCVLICTSDLENILRDMLKHFFSEASSLSKSQEKEIFDYTGPLGTFSTLIKLSRAIGLLDITLYGDLEKIRKIRNNAAHNSGTFSLSDLQNSSIISTMHFDWSKLKKIKRYSLVNKKNKYKVASQHKNENIMKGLGFVRHDKVNFIMTTKQLSLELIRTSFIARAIGAEIPEHRARLLLFIDKKVIKATKESTVSP